MVQNQTALAVEMRTDEGGGGWGVEAHFSCSPKSHWIPKALSRSHALWKVWWENRRGSYSAHAQQTLPSFLFKQLCSFFFFLILICIPNPFNNKPGSGVSFVAGAGWAASGALKIPALGFWCGCAGFLGLCRNACIHFSPCMDQRARRCHSLWGSPGPTGRRPESCPQL